MDWALAWEPKGRQLDSQSGHMPGLQVRSPVGGTWEVTTPFVSATFYLVPCLFNPSLKTISGALVPETTVNNWGQAWMRHNVGLHPTWQGQGWWDVVAFASCCSHCFWSVSLTSQCRPLALTARERGMWGWGVGGRGWGQTTWAEDPFPSLRWHSK